METSRAEALHDLDRNSIGNLGLSGSWVPPRVVDPARREFLIGGSVCSMRVAFGVLERGGGVSAVLYNRAKVWSTGTKVDQNMVKWHIYIYIDVLWDATRIVIEACYSALCYIVLI